MTSLLARSPVWWRVVGGAQLALAEGVRRVAAAGAEPRAALACLDAGHADAPAAAWQRDEMRLGLVDAADRLGLTLPAACGRLHDRAGGAALHPTPVVATLGTLDDVATRTPGGFAHPGDAVVLLGRTGAELSGSAWADAVHGHLGGMPPFPDPAAEAALAGVLVDAARAGKPAPAAEETARREMPTVTERQAADIQALIDEVGADRVAFLAWVSQMTGYPVPSEQEIPAAALAPVTKALEKKRTQKAAA